MIQIASAQTIHIAARPNASDGGALIWTGGVLIRVVESRNELPGPEVWLLARRSLSPPNEIAYYLALAPHTVSLQTLATIAGTRYTVEQCIKEAKGEVGLDQYEVRFWHSWYRHMTLTMMAHAWLADQRLSERETTAISQANGPRSPSAVGDCAPFA